MPTSVPNFNFLAPLVTEIWRGSQNKKVGAADLPRRPLAVKFFICLAVTSVAATGQGRAGQGEGGAWGGGVLRWQLNAGGDGCNMT